MKLYTSRDWLRRRYIVEHKSIQQIADECNVSLNTIRSALKKAGYMK